MYRHSKKITRFGVVNMRLRPCSRGLSNIQQFLPDTDQFARRHIGLNNATEQEMTNFLGLEVCIHV